MLLDWTYFPNTTLLQNALTLLLKHTIICTVELVIIISQSNIFTLVYKQLFLRKYVHIFVVNTEGCWIDFTVHKRKKNKILMNFFPDKWYEPTCIYSWDLLYISVCIISFSCFVNKTFPDNNNEKCNWTSLIQEPSNPCYESHLRYNIWFEVNFSTIQCNTTYSNYYNLNYTVQHRANKFPETCNHFGQQKLTILKVA